MASVNVYKLQADVPFRSRYDFLDTKSGIINNAGARKEVIWGEKASSRMQGPLGPPYFLGMPSGFKYLAASSSCAFFFDSMHLGAGEEMSLKGSTLEEFICEFGCYRRYMQDLPN